MKKIGIVFLSVVVVGVVVFFSGPKLPNEIPSKEKVELQGVNLANIEGYLNEHESKFTIKPNLHSQIVWADSLQQTPYSVVYIPGLGACWPEGEPVHREFARHFGYNLYLHRLYDHGLALPADSIFDDLSPDKLIGSANEALAIGRILGKKVIVMGTSTGCTLSFYLAEQSDIAGFIMLSPNWGLEHRAGTDFLDGPWGKQIARLVVGSEIYRWKPRFEAEDELWSTGYRIEGLVTLRRVLRLVQKSGVFDRIQQPVFVGYYPDDKIISVAAIERLAPKLPNHVLRAFPDAGHHVIGSKITSNSYNEVSKEVISFWQSALSR